MKAVPYKKIDEFKHVQCEPKEATHVRIGFPHGKHEFHLLPVILKGSRKGTGCWSWNGDTEKPTLKPSIVNTWEGYENGKPYKKVNHVWVNDGKVRYLNDCTHKFKGMTKDLVEIED